jgi:hypothetical protein
MVTERGLRDVKLIGRARQAAGSDTPDEVAKLPQIHETAPKLRALPRMSASFFGAPSPNVHAARALDKYTMVNPGRAMELRAIVFPRLLSAAHALGVPGVPVIVENGPVQPAQALASVKLPP